MSTRLQSLLVVTRTGDSNAAKQGNVIAAWCRENSVPVAVMENPPGEIEARKKLLHALNDLAPQPAAVLVLGGDGTMLSVARKLNRSDSPLLGLNLGKVGFLAGLSPDSWQEHLEHFLQNGYSTSSALALECEVRRKGHGVTTRARVVNDLVVARGGLARLVNLEVMVDEEPLGLLRADGVIISTPTGCTGYAVSAKGPLIHPGLPAYGLTPVCSFRNDFPPMVLPGPSETRITVCDNSSEVFMTLDGQQGVALQEGDVIAIRRSEQDFTIIRTPGHSYFKRLQNKGFLFANSCKTP